MADWADEWTALRSPKSTCSRSSTPSSAAWRESLYNLAAATNNDRWAKAGDRFTKKSFFNPLALAPRRTARPSRQHPYPAGDRRRPPLRDLRRHALPRCGRFLLYEVVNGRTYVTGGTSNGEAWLGQPRQLAAELKLSTATAECCCAYNMLKLTRHLYSWTATRATSTTTSARAQSPARHHPAGEGLHAVLPLAHARRVEDLQHRRPVVLVLHRLRRRRIFQAQRQHLLARRRGSLRQSVHPVRTRLDGEGSSSSPGNQIPRAAGHQPDGDRRQAGADGDPAARSRMARIGAGREAQRPSRSRLRPRRAAISRSSAPGRTATASRWNCR